MNDDKHFTHQLTDVFDMYSDVCEWFNSLGFQFSKTRYGIYKKNFDLFNKFAIDKNKKHEIDNEKLLILKKGFDNAYMEANEIIRIYSNLKDVSPSEFIEQIKKVVSGQEFRANVDNDQARDFLFELSVASRFIKAGFSVSLTGICDVVVDLEKFGVLFVECKRIKSVNRIEANIKKANKQILDRIKRNNSSEAKGLVAVNITDIIPKNGYFLPDTPQVATAIHRIISNSFVRNNIEKFISGNNKECLGVMCESSMMHYFSDKSTTPGVLYSRHSEYLAYSENPLFEYLAKKTSGHDIK